MNSAGRKPQLIPSLDAAGSIRSRLPSKMMQAKATEMILVGLNGFLRCLSHQDNNFRRADTACTSSHVDILFP